MATFFSATINLPGSVFPLTGEATEENLLLLANNGTTPHGATEALQSEARRIGDLLATNKMATTKSATIRPITEEEYNRIK